MRTLINEGYIIPGTTDSTGSQPESSNPWHSIWCLVTRKNLRGEVHTPEECLTPLEALRVFTLWGAYGAFEEKRKGSLEPGKLADFCILDGDLMTMDQEQIRNMKVNATIVGGEIKYATGDFSGLSIHNAE